MCVCISCLELNEISDASCLWIRLLLIMPLYAHEYGMLGIRVMIDGTYSIIADSRSNCITSWLMDIEWTNAMASLSIRDRCIAMPDFDHNFREIKHRSSSTTENRAKYPYYGPSAAAAAAAAAVSVWVNDLVRFFLVSFFHYSCDAIEIICSRWFCFYCRRSKEWYFVVVVHHWRQNEMGWMLALGNLNIWMIKPNKIMAVAIAFNTFSARRLCSNMGKAGRLSRHHAENDIPNLCIFRFIFLFSLFWKIASKQE